MKKNLFFIFLMVAAVLFAGLITHRSAFAQACQYPWGPGWFACGDFELPVTVSPLSVPQGQPVTINGNTDGSYTWVSAKCADGSQRYGLIGAPVRATYNIDSNSSYPYAVTSWTRVSFGRHCPDVFGSDPFDVFAYSITVDTTGLSLGQHTVYLYSTSGQALEPLNDVSFRTQVSFTVTAPPMATITVTSENSQVTSTLVSSAWDFSAASDPCTNQTIVPCLGTQQTYPNQQANINYTIMPTPGSAPGYAFHSIERLPIAERPGGIFDRIFSVVKSALISAANAFSFPPGNPQTQTLAAGGVANFVILWDPVASMSVTPSLAINSTNGYSGAATVTNTGSQGSTLGWNVSNLGSLPAWLRLSKTSGGPVGAGSSDSITISANITGLSPGPYSATVSLKGTSSPGCLPAPVGCDTNSSISISLTVAGGPLAVNIISPTPAAAGVPVQVSCTGGTGSYAWSSTGSPAMSGTTGSTITVTYPAQGTYSLTCTDSAGTSDTKSIVITPDCRITASQTKVVPPQSSTLTWSCSPGTAVSCTINGNATINGTPVGTGGSASVSPTQSSAYVLSCIANNGLGSAMPPASVLVTVQGPGVIETNP